jgi:LITAF-like zinc ribbon domain
MLIDLKTPSKDLPGNISPSQEKKPTGLVFSTSTHKSTRVAAKRYSSTNLVFDKVELLELNEDTKPGKLLTYEPFRPASNAKPRRKSSIDTIPQYILKNRTFINHSKNVSEIDSVIYRNPEQIPIKKSYTKNSLPTLESTPCTMFCKYCSTQVHTIVEFYSTNLPFKMLNIFSSLISCCQVSLWVNSMMVHKCPNCNLVLGKVGNNNI